MSLKRFDQLVGELRSCLGALPDKRTGANTQYTMETIGLSAFSVFFTQSPSFLAHQRTMEQNKGQSNAQTLFQVEKTPTDNHIRDMLDPVEPEAIYPVYDRVYEAFEEQGILHTFRSVQDTRLIALDGTWYFSSQSENIHCPNCSKIEHTNGEITHYHSAITPVIVGPGQPYHTYRYANGAPLVEAEGSLKVNWCEVTVTRKGKQIHHNAFITDWTITNENLAGIIAAGRARWKIENENNNTLKRRGYHLEHNFGHGNQHLSSMLAALNILAFLFHSFLTFCDEAYTLIRATLPTRQTFFQHVRALTTYMRFSSWEHLMDFMMQGLEIGPYEPT